MSPRGERTLRTVRLVLAHRPGEPLVPLRALTAEEQGALARHYREGHDEPSLGEWLTHLVRLHLWIACDCRSAHEQPPLMFVRLGPKDRAVLARMPDRPPHTAGCPFASAPALPGAADMPMGLAPLAQLLYRWFGAARLNVLYPYDAEDALSHQYASLREVSKSLNLASGRRLYDFSRTHPQGLPALFRRLARAADEAPGGRLTTGLYLTLTSSLERIELPPGLEIRDPPHREGSTSPIEQLPGTADVGGPYVLLIELAAHPPHRIGVQRIFAQPVYSKGLLVPIHSALERRTLCLLLDVQRSLLSGHHRLVSLRKTLPDAPVCERGVAFQVQTLGPNGRAARTLDVLSVDADHAYREGILLESDSETLYHRVGATEGALSSTDQSFRRRLLACLMCADEVRIDSTRHVRESLAS